MKIYQVLQVYLLYQLLVDAILHRLQDLLPAELQAVQLWQYCFYSGADFFFAPQGRHARLIKVKYGRSRLLVPAK